MVFTDEQKLLINNDSTQKQLHITFPNNTDIAEITNDRIYQEEMSLEESLIDQDNIQFGKCNGALFTVKVADFVDNIEGARMDVSITFSNSTLGTTLDVPLGRFIVNEPPERTADRRFKIIKAQDYMILFDVDIAEWYNTVLFPTDDTTRTLYECLEMICEYIGVDFDTEFGFIHSNLVIKKNIAPTQLSGRDFLQQICELEACFGHFNELGVLSFIRLEKSALYPSETLYPRNDLYPRGSSETERITLYKNCDYKDYDVKSINSVKIRMEDDDIGVVSQLDGITRVNQYTITGNMLTYGLSAETLLMVSDNILEYVKGLQYRPNATTVKGGTYMKLGQSYTVLTNNDGFESYVLNRTLNGIQGISVMLEADGEEYIAEIENNPSSEVRVLKGKVSRLKHDMESLVLEFEDFEESTRAQIEVSAEGVKSTVGKTQNVWDVSNYDTSEVYFGYGYPTIKPDGTYINYLDIETGIIYHPGVVEGGTPKWYKKEQLKNIMEEMESEIDQTAEQILLKVSKGEVSSQLSVESKQITLTGNRLVVDSTNFNLDEDGSVALTGEVHATEFVADEKLSIKSGWLIDGVGNYEDVLYTEQERLSDGRIWSYIHAAISYIEKELTINGVLHAMAGIYGGVTNLTQLKVTGTKSRLASTDNYNDRLLYCYEMPSPIFGDVGHGVIGEDGLCYVDIDAIFLETIDTNQNYHVFLQPYSDKQIYVYQKECGYFIVKGEPNTHFDWEIKAKQLDFPMERLEENIETEVVEEVDYEKSAIEYLSNYEKELTDYE